MAMDLRVDIDPQKEKGTNRKATPLEQYKQLQSEVQRCRAREDSLLDEMDVVWKTLTDEEHQKLNQEPPLT